MAYKLEVNHPAFPKGTEFDLDGILVKNGETVEIPAEKEAWFKAYNKRTIHDIYGHGRSKIVKLTGTSALAKPKGGEK